MQNSGTPGISCYCSIFHSIVDSGPPVTSHQVFSKNLSCLVTAILGGRTTRTLSREYYRIPTKKHMLHVWNIYPKMFLEFMVNIGKYSIYMNPGIPTTIKTMGVNTTTIVYLRVLIIQIGSTIILMVVEA